MRIYGLRKTLYWLIWTSAFFSTFALKAPARPLSEVTTSTQDFLISRSPNSGGMRFIGVCDRRFSAISRDATAYGRADKANCCALRILVAETTSIALVIWLVFFTDLIRCLMVLIEAIYFDIIYLQAGGKRKAGLGNPCLEGAISSAGLPLELSTPPCLTIIIMRHII